MAIGVLIFEGMKVGFLPGDMQISIDKAGIPKSHAILSTAYNVLPIWIRIAHDNLKQSKNASIGIPNNWNKLNDEKRKELLIAELEPSLQVFVSCGIVLDCLYDQLREYAKITDDEIKKWRENKTSRDKQIAEVIRRVFNLKPKIFKNIAQNIREIIKYRDLAVHPSHELKNACNRPDIPVGVDWKFSVYRYSNSEKCYTATIEIVKYLFKIGNKNDKVTTLINNIFKALRELKVID